MNSVERIRVTHCDQCSGIVPKLSAVERGRARARHAMHANHTSSPLSSAICPRPSDFFSCQSGDVCKPDVLAAVLRDLPPSQRLHLLHVCTVAPVSALPLGATLTRKLVSFSCDGGSGAPAHSCVGPGAVRGRAAVKGTVAWSLGQNVVRGRGGGIPGKAGRPLTGRSIGRNGRWGGSRL